MLDGAIEIIKSGNDVKKACDMETCSSSSSEEEQDHAVQTANDPVPEVIYKTQDLIKTESRLKKLTRLEQISLPRILPAIETSLMTLFTMPSIMQKKDGRKCY